MVFNNTLLVVFVFTFHCGHIQDGSHCFTNLPCLFMYMFYTLIYVGLFYKNVMDNLVFASKI